MKLIDRLTRPKSTLDKTPVDATAGEATSLLTQTAGAMFGLMPALMAKSAGAAPGRHAEGDGGASTAAAADHAAALGDMALKGSGPAGTHLGQAMPVATLQDGHGTEQAAPHTVQNESPGGDPAHAPHAAHGSSAAPQPLHLPDTAHEASHLPSVGDPVTSPHEQVHSMQADAMPTDMGQTVFAQGALMPMGESGLPHAADGLLGLSSAPHNPFHALDGEAASIGGTAHASLAALQGDVAQSLGHVADAVGQTLSAADQVVGNVKHLASDAGRLDPGSLAHDLHGDLSQTTSSLAGTVAHILSPADQGAGNGSHDALSGGGSGAPESLVHGAGTLLATTSHGIDAPSHIGGATGSASDPGGLLHASAVAPHADAPPASVLSSPQSDIGHAASLTSDGSPLHLPLIGQSYMDHDVGHDLGFSLHALHGI